MNTENFVIFIFNFACLCVNTYGNEVDNSAKFHIEGRVIRPQTSVISEFEWFGSTSVYTNTGHKGFLRENGTFVINNLEWGSHVIQVMNPTFLFESARVDISSKGKIRARSVNHIQPSKVDLMPYPLKLKSIGPLKYFQQREQWRLTDFLFNPMVLMTILPLVFLLVIPRLGDMESRSDMDQLQMPKLETPELSEFVTNILGGGLTSSSNSQKSAIKAKAKRKDK